jgi:hypothetical protein
MWRNDPSKYVLIRNGRKWRFMEDDRRRWFARDDADSDTGPFSSLDDAREWVEAIRP